MKPNAVAEQRIWEHVGGRRTRLLTVFMKAHDWDVTTAAEELGVSKATLFRVLRSYPDIAKARIADRAKMALKKVS